MSARTTTTATAVRTLTIDTSHSEVAFQVRHLLSRVRGRFSDFDGTITFDEEQPDRSAFVFTARTTSVDTNHKDRDAHLRSDDFFAAEQFPTLSFTSTRVTPRGNNEFEVEGDLTIRGVTRSIAASFSYQGRAVDPWGNEKFAFEGEATINRKDFGLNWNAALETGGFLVGDDVKIHVALEAA